MPVKGKHIAWGLILLLVAGVAGWITWIIIVGGTTVTPVTAADAWEVVLKNCDQNQTLKIENMVYLGPSNNTGVGTVWQKLDGGGYELRRLPTELPANTFLAGNWSTCAGTTQGEFNVKSGAEVVLPRTEMSAAAHADLQRAKKVELKVDAWREVQLVGDTFSDWINGLPAQDGYKQSLLRTGRVLAYRVIEVKGMTATLTFDQAAAALQTKLAVGGDGKPKIEAGDVKLNAEFKGNNVLEIKAPETFVIEAEFTTYDPTSRPANMFAPVPAIKNAPLKRGQEGP